MQEFNESTNGRCEKPDVDVQLRLLTCQQKALRKLHHVSSCVSIQLISMNIQNMTKKLLNKGVVFIFHCSVHFHSEIQ